MTPEEEEFLVDLSVNLSESVMNLMKIIAEEGNKDNSDFAEAVGELSIADQKYQIVVQLSANKDNWIPEDAVMKSKSKMIGKPVFEKTVDVRFSINNNKTEN